MFSSSFKNEMPWYQTRCVRLIEQFSNQNKTVISVRFQTRTKEYSKSGD